MMLVTAGFATSFLRLASGGGGGSGLRPAFDCGGVEGRGMRGGLCRMLRTGGLDGPAAGWAGEIIGRRIGAVVIGFAPSRRVDLLADCGGGASTGGFKTLSLDLGFGGASEDGFPGMTNTAEVGRRAGAAWCEIPVEDEAKGL